MRLIARGTLREYWERDRSRREAERPLRSWIYEVQQADWATPADVKMQFRNASILRGNRVVFNIAGNKFKPVVKVNYAARIVYVRFIGTHSEYDAIDAEKV